MIEETKKHLLTGFGAVLLTKEMLEDATRKLVDDAKLSTDEAQKLAEDLCAIGSQQCSEIEAMFSKSVSKSIESLDLASRQDLSELRLKVERLEQRLERIEKKLQLSGQIDGHQVLNEFRPG
jgi:polyhydroxyalkanoate synthesis regulator phasin